MLAQWQGDFGADPDSDADGDGDSDGADFLTWQRNLGPSATTSTIAAVPEPTGWVLGAICFTFFAWRCGVFSANCPRRHLMSAAVLICCPAADVHADDPVTVPPAKMVTTSGQKGMQPVGEIFHRTNEEGFGHSGASNVFLVDAAELNDAIAATAQVLLGSRAADTPASNESGPVSGSHWLVAFLGASHSSPVRWIVENVTVTGNDIRLTYHQPESAIATSDIHRYYYWVPLGKLAPGTYAVELFDADEKAVTLMRRVKVEAKPK